MWTGGAQLDDRGYRTELIYIGLDQDYDFGDGKKQQVGTGEGKNNRKVTRPLATEKRHTDMEYFNILLQELGIYFDQTGGGRGRINWVSFMVFMRQ